MTDSFSHSVAQKNLNANDVSTRGYCARDTNASGYLLRIPDPRRFNLRGDLLIKQCIAPPRANRMTIFFDPKTKTFCASLRFLLRASLPRYSLRNIDMNLQQADWLIFPKYFQFSQFLLIFPFGNNQQLSFSTPTCLLMQGMRVISADPNMTVLGSPSFPHFKIFHQLSSPRSQPFAPIFSAGFMPVQRQCNKAQFFMVVRYGPCKRRYVVRKKCIRMKRWLALSMYEVTEQSSEK